MGDMEFLASCCIVGRERIRCPESGTKKRLKG